MATMRDPRDLLSPFLARYCPDPGRVVHLAEGLSASVPGGSFPD
jgi:hypothetical protein